MLLLTAPAQHTADNPAVERDPRRVKLWLEQLPTDKVEETIAKLVAALKPFNELQLDAKSRLRLLETYHNAFETILYTYDELHLRTLPLNYQERRKLSDDIMWVHLELANGYKSIVKAVYEGFDTNTAKNDVLLSIYRAIELIAKALVHAFREHQSAPPLAFLEIHQLYHLAEQYQIEKQPITLLKSHTAVPTIQHLYKQIMLLVAGDPYSYDGKQLYELYHLLDHYIPGCELLSEVPTGEQQQCFLLDFTEDHGPRPCAGQSLTSILPTQRVLDIRATLHQIMASITQEQDVQLVTLRTEELRLLRLFVNNLQHGSIDRTPRKQCNEQARVAYGLEAVSYYLQHRDRFLDDSVETSSGIEVRDIDMFEMEHGLATWSVANATPGGRLFILQQDNPQQIAVGEVVAVFERLSDKYQPLLSTGIIRWVRYEANSVLIGVKLMSVLPLAVSCEIAGDTAEDACVFHGLYFPSDKDRKQPASLLCEYSYFRLARHFHVDVAGQRYRVEPLKIVMESPLHIQFGFKVIK